MRRETSSLPSVSTASIGWHSISGDTSTPPEVVIKGESVSSLLQAISELPPTQSAVIVGRFLDGKQLHEIAGEMDCTVGTVAGMLRRGLEKIRRELPRDVPAET